MEIRSRAIVMIAGAAAAAAAAVVAGSGWAAAATHPDRATESCATQSGADFPRAFTSPRNLVVGPLSLIGAGGSPGFAWNSRGTEGFQKFPLLVRSGHRVTIELSRRTRLGAGLGYGPLPQGETYLRDTYRVVTFIACRRGEHSSSSAEGQPVTFWSGAVLARSPRCIPLRVRVDGERTLRRAVIRLGVLHCG